MLRCGGWSSKGSRLEQAEWAKKIRSQLGEEGAEGIRLIIRENKKDFDGNALVVSFEPHPPSTRFRTHP